jgi:hypothetical protein
LSDYILILSLPKTRMIQVLYINVRTTITSN